MKEAQLSLPRCRRYCIVPAGTVYAETASAADGISSRRICTPRRTHFDVERGPWEPNPTHVHGTSLRTRDFFAAPDRIMRRQVNSREIFFGNSCPKGQHRVTRSKHRRGKDQNVCDAGLVVYRSHTTHEIRSNIRRTSVSIVHSLCRSILVIYRRVVLP